MAPHSLRYQLAEPNRHEEFAALLVLALFSTESLHRAFDSRLAVAADLMPAAGCCVIAADTPAARDLNGHLQRLLAREFGPDEFTVERIAEGLSSASEEAA
jgi:hypothetical protein